MVSARSRLSRDEARTRPQRARVQERPDLQLLALGKLKPGHALAGWLGTGLVATLARGYSDAQEGRGILASMSRATRLARKVAEATEALPEPKMATVSYLTGSPDAPLEASLLAASQVFGSSTVKRPAYWNRTWDNSRQDEALGFYREIGEVGFSVRWQANAVSRLWLYPVKGKDTRADDGSIYAKVVEEFAGGRGNQAQLMFRAAMQLTLAGDTWIVVKGDNSSAQAYSHQEITPDWRINRGGGASEASAIPETDLVMRCWQPDPGFLDWPDSAFMRMLPVLRELKALTQYVSAQVDSRLASGGMLILPTSLKVPGMEDGRSFTEYLIKVMSAALANPASAAAKVPIVIQVPDDLVGKSQYMTFSTILDQFAKELRDEGIRRVALGSDSPPEVVLGLGTTSHWGSWRISDDATQIAVVPLGEVIAACLTEGWYRAALQQMGVEDWADWRLGVDAHQLELRPDRSAAALSLYDRGEFSPKSLRRESGFTEADKPTSAEVQAIAAFKAASAVPGAQLNSDGTSAVLPEVTTPEAEAVKRGQPVAPGAQLNPATNTRPGTSPDTGAPRV